MNRITTFCLLLTGMVGGAVAQVDVTKLINGNQASPEALASIRYGAEGKLIWIFLEADRQ